MRSITVSAHLLLQVADYEAATELQNKLSNFCSENLIPGFSLIFRTEGTEGVEVE